MEAILAYAIGLAVLLLLSAFFSGSETALFSLSRSQVQQLRKSGTGAGQAVGQLLGRPRRLLITILVGNMFVNVATASVLASLATRLLGNKGVGAAIGVTTLLLLILGEVTPKTFAVRHAEGFSLFAARPLALFAKMIWPLRVVLAQVTGAILFLLRQGHVQSDNLLTRDDLQALVKAGESEGVVEEHETEIVENIFELRDIAAREIMTPRTEIVRIPETARVEDALALCCESGHSRIPVCGEHDGEIWGIFHVKDMPAWMGHDIGTRTIRDLVAARDAMAHAPQFPLVHAAFLVPEACHIDALLQHMRRQRTHIAILLDEYGGTSGLVTMGDLLERLVGELVEEEEDAEDDYARRGSVITASGQARIRDINRDLDLDIPLGKTDTVGGYVMDLLGRLPSAGEVASDGIREFRVLEVTPKRIERVQIRHLAKPATNDE